MKKLNYILIGIAILVIIALGVFFSYSTTGKVISSTTDASPPRIINIAASSFQYTPSVINVKAGEHVKIVVENQDKTHGITIPDLGVSGIDSVDFTATKPGTYQFKCPTMCGSGHRDMTGTLIVA